MSEKNNETGISIGIIGAGRWGPNLIGSFSRLEGVEISGVVDLNKEALKNLQRKFPTLKTTTSVKELLLDQSINAVAVCTPVETHIPLVEAVLEAGKHVFVEKPLCLKLSELDYIKSCFEEAKDKEGQGPSLMVGFNRRFSPLVVKAKSLLNGVQGPKSFIMTVNAGKIPEEHWTQDPLVGGGRILGEGCHFIDLLRFLAQSPVESADIIFMDSKTGDTASISLVFENGSIGVIHYFANGNKSYPKERLEIFSGQRILQIDNFRRLEGYGWPNFRKMKLWRQDKGQDACAKAFIESIKSNSSAPIPIEELLEVGRISIELNG